jgi:hypothetical protein
LENSLTNSFVDVPLAHFLVPDNLPGFSLEQQIPLVWLFVLEEFRDHGADLQMANDYFQLLE